MAFILLLMIVGLVWAIMYLTSGKVNQKQENTVIQSRKTAQEITDQLRQLARELNAQVDKIQDDPFGKFGSSSALAVVLYGEERGLSRNMWAVQVYVAEKDNGCEVELVAIGEGLSAGYSGTYYTGRISMKSSRARRGIIASRL